MVNPHITLHSTPPDHPNPWFQMMERMKAEGFQVPYWQKKAIQNTKKIRHPKQGYAPDRIPQLGAAKVIGMIGMDKEGVVVDVSIPDITPFFVIELSISGGLFRETIICNQLEYYWRYHPLDKKVIMGDLRLSMEDRKIINNAVKTFRKTFRQPLGDEHD